MWKLSVYRGGLKCKIDFHFKEPLEGVLKEWGDLTRTLVETLTELQSGKPEVYSPQRLLGLLHTKCPQFAGFDQHDSHELLRQLLEMVRTEDLQVGRFGDRCTFRRSIRIALLKGRR